MGDSERQEYISGILEKKREKDGRICKIWL